MKHYKDFNYDFGKWEERREKEKLHKRLHLLDLSNELNIPWEEKSMLSPRF